MSMLNDNLELLRSALKLLESIPDSDYASRQIDGKVSGIGSHLRHVIDHYECFLLGLPRGEINFDARTRCLDIENSTSAAVGRLKELISKIENLTDLRINDPLKIIMASGTEGKSEVTHSSVGRELQFLVSHTVHHYAIISIFCHQHGLPQPKNFGVAPSTIKYQIQSEN